MSDINTLYCSISLRESRKEAARLKIKLPKLITWCGSDRTYWEVWGREGSDSTLVYSGSADCSTDAKSKAIDRLMRKAVIARGEDPDEVIWAEALKE